MRRQQLKDYGKIYKTYAIISIVLYGLLMYLFPYTSDDMFWGSSLGLEQLHQFFRNYNGRYLGNLLVLGLTRDKMLRVLVGMICFILIMLVISKFIDRKENKFVVLLTTGTCLLFLPRQLLTQTIVWTAGFTNYIPPVVLMLLYLLIMKRYLNKEYVPLKKGYIVIALIIGICSSLFIEHITLFNLLLGLTVVIYIRIKYKKINGASIGFFVGAIIGAVIMFQNPSYHQIAIGAYAGRSIGVEGTSFLDTMIPNLFGIIYTQLILCNIWINVLLSGLVFILTKRSTKFKKIGKILSGYLIIYTILSGIYYFGYYIFKFNIINVNLSMDAINVIGVITSVIFYIVLLIAIIIFTRETKNKIMGIFLILAIGSLTVPLFVVSPIGPRCFIPMYILFAFLIGILINDISFNRKNIRALGTIFIVASIIGFGRLFYIYTPIAIMTAQRNYVQKVEVKEGMKQIEIPNSLPNFENINYVWHWVPIGYNTYKTYYHIPLEDTIVPIDNKTWYKKYKNILEKGHLWL